MPGAYNLNLICMKHVHFFITTNLTSDVTHLRVVHPLVEGECEAWVSRDVFIVECDIQTIVEVPVKKCRWGEGM